MAFAAGAPFWAALESSSAVLLMCSAGALMYFRGMFDGAARKTFSRVITEFLLPCLLFTNVVPRMSWERLAKWWVLPFSLVLFMLIGMVLGYVVARVTRVDAKYVRLVAVVCGFGNTTSIPLALVSSLAATSPDLFALPGESTRSAQEVLELGTAYVLVFTVLSNLLRWSIAYAMLEPPKTQECELLHVEGDVIGGENCGTGGGEEDQGERKETEGGEREEGTEHVELQPEIEMREIEMREIEMREIEMRDMSCVEENLNDFGDNTEGAELDDSGAEDGDEHSQNEGHKWLIDGALSRAMGVVAPFRQQAAKMMTTPVIVSFVCIVIGLIPPLRKFLFKEDSAVAFLIEPIRRESSTVVPLTLLVLGGNMTDRGDAHASLPVSVTVCVCIIRLVLLPWVAAGVVTLYRAVSLIPNDDPLFIFVLLLESATPSAINLSVITTLHGHLARETSTLLFYEYITAVVLLTINVWLFITYIV